METGFIITTVFIISTLWLIIENKKKDKKIEGLNEEKDKKIEGLNEENKNLIRELKLTSTIDEKTKQEFNELLFPLGQTIRDFKDKIDGHHNHYSEKFGGLNNSLARLENMNQTLGDEASKLASALRGDRQQQGRWGELTLENILERSGLIKGHDYNTQVSYYDKDGSLKRLDFVVNLSGNKFAIIDSKVSINSYSDFIDASTQVDQRSAAKSLVRSIRNHSKELSEKNYGEYKGGTHEYTFMFLPLEGMFSVAIQTDPSLFEELLLKKIIVVHPTTILSTLKTIHLFWQNDRANESAIKILEEAGSLHDKIYMVVESFSKMENQMHTLTKTFVDTKSQLYGPKTGLIRQIQSLDNRGTKKDFAKLN